MKPAIQRVGRVVAQHKILSGQRSAEIKSQFQGKDLREASVCVGSDGISQLRDAVYQEDWERQLYRGLCQLLRFLRFA
jgi:hypothetical protein